MIVVGSVVKVIYPRSKGGQETTAISNMLICFKAVSRICVFDVLLLCLALAISGHGMMEFLLISDLA